MDAPSKSTLIAGAIAGAVPFAISMANASYSTVNGEVVSATYRDWVAIGGGAAAVICGLAAIAAFARATKLPLAAAGLAVVALGGYQIARGFGAFYKPDVPTSPRAHVDLPPVPDLGKEKPVSRDPATCPDRDACDNLHADLAKSDPAGALVARARSCDFGADYACEEAAEGWLKKDPAKARAFYDKACALKRGSSCNELGVMFLNGDGVAKDLDKGRAYLEKACTHGQALGCKNLAVVYDQGLGVPADPAKAFEHAKRSCAIDHWMADDAKAVGYACNMAGGALYTGAGVPVDKKAAADMFARACDRSRYYCYNLGVVIMEGVIEKDAPRARALYEASCDDGKPDACNNLGDMMRKGEGGPKDPQGAKKLFQKACDGEVELGCQNLKLK